MGPSEHLSTCLYFLPFLFSSLFFLASQDWLTKFGYLPPPDPVTGQLQTQEELTKAITAMQRFGGLEATGVLGQCSMSLPLRRRGMQGWLLAGPGRRGNLVLSCGVASSPGKAKAHPGVTYSPVCSCKSNYMAQVLCCVVLSRT